jgi:fatty-acyl-CoA synthase
LPERISQAATAARGVTFVGHATGGGAGGAVSPAGPSTGAGASRAGFRGPDGGILQGMPVSFVSWAQLHEEALALALELRKRGAKPGERVALLGTTSRALATAVQATWLAGAAVVVLPLPARLTSVDDFAAATKARLRSAEPCCVLMSDELVSFEDLLGSLARTERLEPLVETASRARGKNVLADLPPVGLDDLAVLQYTSGSTSDPKGVTLTHRQIGAQIDGATAAAGFDPTEDVMVSWLPLYHDMGLIGFLTVPMATGTSLVQASPQDFTSDPLSWIALMSASQATVSAGPNFAYVLATRAMKRAQGLDLSRWRIALNGAEPVSPSVVEGFVGEAERFGFDGRAAFPAFGMAEATLAVTFPEPFTGVSEDVVRKDELETSHLALPASREDVEAGRARRLARLGRPIPGLSIQVVDPATGEVLSERMVGELEVRGACVTDGYWKNPEATAVLKRGEWLSTGDLAYVAEGELVVCGRMKDLIIVAGRNVYPEDIESAASSVPGVRAGNVIAFGVEGRKGREAVVVVAEAKDGSPGEVRDAVARRVRRAAGLSVEDVVLVAPGTLPKTSSGKLQRNLCRARYLKQELATI